MILGSFKYRKKTNKYDKPKYDPQLASVFFIKKLYIYKVNIDGILKACFIFCVVFYYYFFIILFSLKKWTLRRTHRAAVSHITVAHYNSTILLMKLK